jgi:crossover junction endodeoxyribonuclease RuvC
MREVVLGVDPGSRHTGYGVLWGHDDRLQHLAHGHIVAGSQATLEKRLCRIYDTLSELIRLHQPRAVALEEIFLGINIQSALTLGQVRGVIILAAAQARLPVFQYPPLTVKKAVVGYGQASKSQVQLMVEHLLGLKVANQHAADALAVGACHLFHRRWPQ